MQNALTAHDISTVNDNYCAAIHILPEHITGIYAAIHILLALKTEYITKYELLRSNTYFACINIIARIYTLIYIKYMHIYIIILY